MKKLFAYILVGFLCVTLTGCNSKNNEEEGSSTTDNTNETSGNLKYVSTDNELVFMNDDGYYMIFDFDGETIKTVRWIMDYETEERAEAVYNIYTGGSYSGMFDVSVNGSIVTLSYKESYASQLYGALSRTELETYMANTGYLIEE